MTQPRVFGFDGLGDHQSSVKARRQPIESYMHLLHPKHHDADPDRLAGMLGLLRDASEASAHYAKIGPINQYKPKTHGYDLCAHRLRQIEDAKHLLAEGVTL
jgi:hypothetical protein